MLRSASRVAAVFLACLLAACSSLPGLIGHATTSVAAPAQIEPVYVANVRAREADGSYGYRRSDTISYASYDVSVPANRTPAQSPRYNTTNLDPARDFVVAGSHGFDTEAAFDHAVLTATNDRGVPAEAFVYVHGFNTSFDDSVYQLAQIGSDIDIPAARVLFAWPAQTKLTGYLHDADSVSFARTGLQHVLEGLAASGVKRIVIVGYSMGAELVMETLRQMRLTHSSQFFTHLGGVVLFSPDLDIDVFRAQARDMGGLPQPFVVYSAPSDGPLHNFADFFAAGAPRLGAPDSTADLEGLSLIFVDVSNVPQARQPGHLPVATAPTMIADLNRMPKPDLVTYATNAAKGGIPGAQVSHYGQFTYVLLPAPGR